MTAEEKTDLPVFTERFNRLDKLEFLVSRNPQELLERLKQIHLQTDLQTIYYASGFHYAWFYTEAKINKIKEKE